jgi:hypothetical protein
MKRPVRRHVRMLAKVAAIVAMALAATPVHADKVVKPKAGSPGDRGDAPGPSGAGTSG